MSQEVLFALYQGDLMVDDPLPQLQASLRSRGWLVTSEPGVLEVSAHADGDVVTIGPRSCHATIDWISKKLTYPSTKVGAKRVAALRKRQFDACLQLFVNADEIDFGGPLIVDLPTDVQETLNAWIYCRWNGHWLFPANEKPPTCFR